MAEIWKNCEDNKKTEEKATEKPIIAVTKKNEPDAFSDTEEIFYDSEYAPIISLPEVEIVTNEEDEQVVFKMRAKVYRYDSTCDPSEWKERGMGEMKILHNTVNNAMRVVMRRDKTFKVCANHFITPWMTLQPCFGSDKAFLYMASDFSDEKIVSHCLAVKFATVDNAILFKNKFEEARETVKTKCCLYIGEEEYTKEEEDDEEDDEEEDERKVGGEDNQGEECVEKLAKLHVTDKQLSEEN